MTNEESLKWLENTPHYFSDIEDAVKDQEVRRIIKEALEKQIPYREDVSIGSTKLRKCKCGIHYSQKDIKYCSCCGQAIDWSDDNGST